MLFVGCSGTRTGLDAGLGTRLESVLSALGSRRSGVCDREALSCERREKNCAILLLFLTDVGFGLSSSSPLRFDLSSTRSRIGPRKAHEQILYCNADIS